MIKCHNVKIQNNSWLLKDMNYIKTLSLPTHSKYFNKNTDDTKVW